MISADQHVDPTKFVFVAPVRCPLCRSVDLETNRTERIEGVKQQRKACRTCGHKFFLVFEDLNA